MVRILAVSFESCKYGKRTNITACITGAVRLYPKRTTVDRVGVVGWRLCESLVSRDLEQAHGMARAGLEAVCASQAASVWLTGFDAFQEPLRAFLA
jgi:hypothetical protein